MESKNLLVEYIKLALKEAMKKTLIIDGGDEELENEDELDEFNAMSTGAVVRGVVGYMSSKGPALTQTNIKKIFWADGDKRNSKTEK